MAQGKIKLRVKEGCRHGARTGGKLKVYQEGEVLEAPESALTSFPDKLERAGNRATVTRANAPGTLGGETARKKAASKKKAAASTADDSGSGDDDGANGADDAGDAGGDDNG